jgi:hypothetical protein
VFKIMGGQDKQGFAMKQGVLTNNRVRLLMSPGDQCFRGYGRRDGGCQHCLLHGGSLDAAWMVWASISLAVTAFRGRRCVISRLGHGVLAGALILIWLCPHCHNR